MDEAMGLGLARILKEIKDRVADKPVYITLDIDSIDPAFAPGTGTPEVGGFSSYQVLQLLRGLKGSEHRGGGSGGSVAAFRSQQHHVDPGVEPGV